MNIQTQGQVSVARKLKPGAKRRVNSNLSEVAKQKNMLLA